MYECFSLQQETRASSECRRNGSRLLIETGPVILRFCFVTACCCTEDTKYVWDLCCLLARCQAEVAWMSTTIMQRLRPTARAAQCCTSSTASIRSLSSVRAVHAPAFSSSLSRPTGRFRSKTAGRLEHVGPAMSRCMSSSVARMADAPGAPRRRAVIDVGEEVSLVK